MRVVLLIREKKMKKKWHLYAFIISLGLIAITLIITVYGWYVLPDIVPTHFGFSGQPDAWGHKSLFNIFFAPALQILITSLFVFLYFKPQYTNLPTTMFIMTLPEKQKEKSIELIRNVTVMTVLWINILFAYVALMIIEGAYSNDLGYAGWGLLILIIVFLVWLVWYNIYIYKIIKKDLCRNPFTGKKIKP